MAYDYSMLNADLITQQGLDGEEVQYICELHDRRERLFEEMKEMDPKKEQRKLHMCVDILTDIEYDLQDAWGFPRSRNHHTWWYVAPHCTCVKMLNHQQFGSPYKHIESTCPLHGNITWTSNMEKRILQGLCLISHIDPLHSEEFYVSQWKDYSNRLNSSIQRFKDMFVR